MIERSVWKKKVEEGIGGTFTSWEYEIEDEGLAIVYKDGDQWKYDLAIQSTSRIIRDQKPQVNSKQVAMQTARRRLEALL